MVTFNYQAKEVAIKIVYYGPGLCGKTTTLQYIYRHIPEDKKRKMISLATETDRTLFFDFLPIQLGKVKGFQTKIQLYTVPGQVFYNQTRKLVLKGVDGIVFVADSQEGMLEANKESLQNLMANLESLGMHLKDIPHVMQYNKRDLPNLIDVETLNKELNIYNVPYFETSAIEGFGIFETLESIIRLTVKHITNKYNVEIKYLIDKVEDEPVKQPEVLENEHKAVEPQEISAEDLAEMDTDINISVDFEDLEQHHDEEIELESLDSESFEEIDEVLEDESIEEISDDLETVEMMQEESEFKTQKVDSNVVEDRVETKGFEDDVIEVEAPRIVKAENGFFVPIKLKIPENMKDEIRVNFDLRIEIKRKGKH